LRCVFDTEAALDLLQIWRYIAKQSGVEIADRVESVIRDKIVFRCRTLAQEFDEMKQ
jgi:hypothetical protein